MKKHLFLLVIASITIALTISQNANAKKEVQQYIHDQEVVNINDYLVYFYWGRYPDHYNLDGRLGGGTFAIYKGDSAIVVDTGNLPGQGKWVKKYLQSKYHIKNFVLINTHWHLDHITDNYLYKDYTISGHTRTREIMLENKDAIESGTLWSDTPPFPVFPPNATFEGRFDLWLDDMKVELHEFTIHSEGHIAIYLPNDKILLAADMLEDPIWIFNFDFATPKIQLAEFERMMAMDIDHIYSNHCNVETVKAGGYDKNFIENNADYLSQMIAEKDSPNFFDKMAQDYIGDALDAGELTWWEPYSEIHGWNIWTVCGYYNSCPP